MKTLQGHGLLYFFHMGGKAWASCGKYNPAKYKKVINFHLAISIFWVNLVKIKKVITAKHFLFLVFRCIN